MYVLYIYSVDNINVRKERFEMKSLKRKLTSRKLWLSVASFSSMLMIYFGHAESEASQVAALIMAGASVVGYVIGEGLADGNNGNGGNE